MRYPDLTDESLVLLLKDDDADAFETIYQRYWRHLFGFVSQQLGSREDAEEIMHDLMLGLWQNRRHSEIQNLRVYFFVAARNLVNKYIRSQINLRKYREYQVLHEILENTDSHEPMNAAELAAAVEDVLRRMPEKTALIFKKSKMEELPVKKIASQMGMSDKAVEYHITKSLKMLRYHLRHFYGNS